jgi:hypothetical protein
MQIRYKPGRLAAATIIKMDPEPQMPCVGLALAF